MSSSPAPERKPSMGRTTEEPTLASNPYNPNSVAYLAYPVKHVMSSLYRRMTEPPDQPIHRLLDAPTLSQTNNLGKNALPRRTASPFQPPPLTPLELQHSLSSRSAESLLLTRSLAEEIRLLIPPRLQLVDHWRLAYALELHGSSLGTLYDHCAKVSIHTQRSGYVIVVRDGSAPAAQGSVFGAYLSDAPKPSPHYFGTGECFLWRASILPSLISLSAVNQGLGGQTSNDMLKLAGLPLPPSADTTFSQRATTIRGERRTSSAASSPNHSRSPPPMKRPNGIDTQMLRSEGRSGTSTPDRIRFKAFPYSGINDFMIHCESSYLSIGGGDGRYGLWLNDTLDNGISETCPTFGNEPLSDEGKHFDVLGVEVWYVGA